MTTGRQVVGVTEEPVGTPHDDVRRTGGDDQRAARADVLFDGRRRPDGLDGERPAMSGLDDRAAPDRPGDVVRGLVRSTCVARASRSIASGHDHHRIAAAPSTSSESGFGFQRLSR